MTPPTLADLCAFVRLYHEQGKIACPHRTDNCWTFWIQPALEDAERDPTETAANRLRSVLMACIADGDIEDWKPLDVMIKRLMQRTLSGGFRR